MNALTETTQARRTQGMTFIILAITLLTGLFYTWDAYTAYIENQDTLTKTRIENVDKKKVLDNLMALGGEDGNGGRIQSDAALKDSLERYAGTFREDAIIDSIFAKGANVSISSITIGKGGKLPNGLSMADISLSLRAPNIATLNNYLDYLTEKKENKKSYVIKNLSFPFDSTKDESVNVSLSLGMYYFD